MNAVKQIRRLAADWRRQIGAERHGGGTDEAGVLAALAYHDRIARQRSAGSFLTSTGRGARLDSPEVQLGRAPCRESGCQDGEISVVGVHVKQNMTRYYRLAATP